MDIDIEFQCQYTDLQITTNALLDGSPYTHFVHAEPTYLAYFHYSKTQDCGIGDQWTYLYDGLAVTPAWVTELDVSQGFQSSKWFSNDLGDVGIHTYELSAELFDSTYGTA